MCYWDGKCIVRYISSAFLSPELAMLKFSSVNPFQMKDACVASRICRWIHAVSTLLKLVLDLNCPSANDALAGKIYIQFFSCKSRIAV